MEGIGSRIKAAREAAGMTQEQLGQKIGVTGVAIMRYEKGQRELTVKNLEALADALGVTASYLLGNQPTEEPMEEMNTHIALKRMDVKTLEKLLHFPKGYLDAIPLEDLHSLGGLDEWAGLSSEEMQGDLRKMVEREREKEEKNRKYREEKIALVVSALHELNDFALSVALERIKELSEIPRYKLEEFYASSQHSVQQKTAPGDANTESGKDDTDH